MECCVPQGSIPKLYSSYTLPLGTLAQILILYYHFYADDSQLWKSFDPNITKEASLAFSSLKVGISEFAKWMFANRLQLNQDKTEFMIIGLKRQTNKLTRSSLELDNETIQSSGKARNLGVIMDSQLDMHLHVNHICQLCFYQIGNIWKI